ncbi:phosphotransferase family protein [Piscinibacterium candidicorallinum]|uniref:Phosphotransferase family protein n=1 Tax=Piscinibacterium candidicorallinum TaxID=1793872 RepID=A0ABV7H318_9BURK
MTTADEQFSGTRALAANQNLDLAALEAWLGSHVPGFVGPLTIEQFKGGQSNPTFKLITPGAIYVMRAKPGPVAKLLPSAHAIEREYAVMKALQDTDVPVPRMLALCEDESVIGRAFFIMGFVAGRVFWEQSLPTLTPAERAPIYDEMNRVIAALHSVDYVAVGLADYGKPGNYFERQIGRWTKQYKASETETIEAMDRLIEWLPQNIPAGESVAIVHGDFRLDNLIFHPTEPRVLAVLDWELSTLGDPMADFSYHLMSWHIPPGQFRGIAGLDLAELNIPNEREYVERYCERTGRAPIAPEHMRFYMAYNMFRLAGILQGIMKRVVDGTASSAQAVAAGKAARPLAEMGWKYAQSR